MTASAQLGGSITPEVAELLNRLVSERLNSGEKLAA